MKYVAHLSDEGDLVYVIPVYPERGEVTYVGAGAVLCDTLADVSAHWPGIPQEVVDGG